MNFELVFAEGQESRITQRKTLETRKKTNKLNSHNTESGDQTWEQR
jgi:hypothetical protein